MSSTKTPSLKSLALKKVKKRYIKVKYVLELMRFFEQIDWMIEGGLELKQDCLNFVSLAYKCVRQQYNPEELREMVGDDIYGQLEENIRLSESEVKRIKITGRVIERAHSQPDCHPNPKPLTRSVSGICSTRSNIFKGLCKGRAAYPYETLTEGQVYPRGVDHARREEYLDTEDFEKVFGISFELYSSYPRWKQIRIKKEKELF